MHLRHKLTLQPYALRAVIEWISKAPTYFDVPKDRFQLGVRRIP